MKAPANAVSPARAEQADDRRIAPRRKIVKSAGIFWHQAPIQGCPVRNISETGACPEVGEPVPDAFVLMVGRTICSCRVVWRRAIEIGVQFVT